MNYFAAPIAIGRGAFAEPDFPTPEKLIRHLDYLDIDRALVYNVDALHYSPARENPRLLEMISRYADRLKPAFVLAPSNFFEHGVLDWLKDQAARGNKSYVVRPTQSCFPLRDIERLLSELHRFRPVFFLEHRGKNLQPADFPDLVMLAERYPMAFFVICREMWGTQVDTIHAMWRCPNIGVDTSFMHMRNGFEFFAREFGPERVFFGIGDASHYGAAPGALAHAELTANEREMIAHGNLEKLLGVPPLARKLADFHERPDKPLWNAFRKGRPLEGVKVIDAHTHFADPNPRGWILPEVDPAENIREMVRAMDRYGVAASALVANRALFSDMLEGNLEVERLTKPYPGRFMGYFTYNPWRGNEVDEKILDRLFARDYFIGFKLIPSRLHTPLDDPRHEIVYRYADKHRLPILIHTWSPEIEHLAEIALRYPRAKFIAGHSGCGNVGRDHIESDAKKADNIYLDFTASFCSSYHWEDFMTKFDRSRYLFGSDAALHNESFELAMLLSLPIPDAEIIPQLAENFERILADRY